MGQVYAIISIQEIWKLNEGDGGLSPKNIKEKKIREGEKSILIEQ